MLFRAPKPFQVRAQLLADRVRLTGAAAPRLLSQPILCDRAQVLEPSKPMTFRYQCRLAPLSDDDR